MRMPGSRFSPFANDKVNAPFSLEGDVTEWRDVMCNSNSKYWSTIATLAAMVRDRRAGLKNNLLIAACWLTLGAVLLTINQAGRAQESGNASKPAPAASPQPGSV